MGKVRDQDKEQGREVVKEQVLEMVVEFTKPELHHTEELIEEKVEFYMTRPELLLKMSMRVIWLVKQLGLRD